MLVVGTVLLGTAVVGEALADDRGTHDTAALTARLREQVQQVVPKGWSGLSVTVRDDAARWYERMECNDCDRVKAAIVALLTPYRSPPEP